MKVYGKDYRAIWVKNDDNKVIQIIDQRNLPHELIIEDIKTLEDTCKVIKDMHVRGAPLIGATAAFGMYLAALEGPQDTFDDYMFRSGEKLISTRPTAINLKWAVHKQLSAIENAKNKEEKIQILFNNANKICDDEIESCRKIGEYGLQIIEKISALKDDQTINILTHCNAGWLACVDYGTATAPIYAAFDKGIKIHVWVSETRPRNQGARLTAWELERHGVPYTIIADNTAGHLLQNKKVDMVIVGSDRTTYTGYVCNKIGTYLKALAAKDNNIMFYAALPSSTIDWEIENGFDIPIEERECDEVKYISGLDEKEEVKRVLLTLKNSKAANYAFDITPPNLITGLITERGVCKSDEASILGLFPEHKKTDDE